MTHSRYVRPSAAGAPDCRCGCVAAEHDHHRPGTDCGHCGNDRCEVYRPVDAPPLRDEPPRPIDGVFDEEGWLAYGSPLPDVRPA